MLLKERIMADIKTAMKAKQKERTSVLRMLLSEIKYAQAATSMSVEISEDDALQVVSTYRKRLEKSLADYPEGDQRTAIENEIKIVDEYLPKKASEQEIVAAIDKLLSSTSERNFGVLMKAIMTQFGSAADGKLISQLLKQKLS